MAKEPIIIREIKPEDNAALAHVIRRTMEEFKINRPHTVYYEPTTDSLFELFQSTPGSSYFVAELDGEVAGGAGIFPTDQLPAAVCELVKMYLSAKARGKGLGRSLINRCLLRARELRYKRVYLESTCELTKAISLYEKFGFNYLDGPIGNSGHNVNVWMIKDIEDTDRIIQNGYPK